MIPDISVVAAVYNEEKFIRDAIESILANDDSLIELIIVDDQSSDGTAKIVTEMAAEDQRIRYFLNDVKGKVSAFNYGVSQARGRHVCLFSGDDTMPQGSLALRSTALDKVDESRAGVALCKLVVMSDDPRTDGQVIPRARDRGTTSGSTIMFNRKAVERCFPAPDMQPNEDTWLELCVSYLPDIEIVHCNVIGCNYRMHSGNSISVMEGFDIYSSKVAIRKRVYSIFLEKFGSEITAQAKAEIEGRMEIERARINGSWIGIARANAPAVQKLRALSIISPLTFWVRRKLFRFFSGW